MALLINGKAYTRQSIEVTIKGRKFRNFESISWDQKLTRAKSKGGYNRTVYRGTASVEETAKLEMLTHIFDEIVELLGDGYGDTPFPIIVTYKEKGLQTRKIELRECVFDSAGESNDDMSKVSVDLDVGEILLNGKRILPKVA